MVAGLVGIVALGLLMVGALAGAEHLGQLPHQTPLAAAPPEPAFAVRHHALPLRIEALAVAAAAFLLLAAVTEFINDSLQGATE